MTRQPWDQGAVRSMTTGLSSAWAFRKASSDHSNQRTLMPAPPGAGERGGGSRGWASRLDFRAADGAAPGAAGAQRPAHPPLGSRAEVQAEDGELLRDLPALAPGSGDLLAARPHQHL